MLGLATILFIIVVFVVRFRCFFEQGNSVAFFINWLGNSSSFVRNFVICLFILFGLGVFFGVEPALFYKLFGSLSVHTSWALKYFSKGAVLLFLMVAAYYSCGETGVWCSFGRWVFCWFSLALSCFCFSLLGICLDGIQSVVVLSPERLSYNLSLSVVYFCWAVVVYPMVCLGVFWLFFWSQVFWPGGNWPSSFCWFCLGYRMFFYGFLQYIGFITFTFSISGIVGGVAFFFVPGVGASIPFYYRSLSRIGSLFLDMKRMDGSLIDLKWSDLRMDQAFRQVASALADVAWLFFSVVCVWGMAWRLGKRFHSGGWSTSLLSVFVYS